MPLSKNAFPYTNKDKETYRSATLRAIYKKGHLSKFERRFPYYVRSTVTRAWNVSQLITAYNSGQTAESLISTGAQSVRLEVHAQVN